MMILVVAGVMMTCAIYWVTIRILATQIIAGGVMNGSDILNVLCLDCEEQWEIDFEPTACICEDPAEDAWILFIRDSRGKWVKSLMTAIEDRHLGTDKNGTDW
jgi:hypothetical protein